MRFGGGRASRGKSRTWSRSRWRRRKRSVYAQSYRGGGEGTSAAVGLLDVTNRDRGLYVLRMPRFLGEILDKCAERELQAAVEQGTGAKTALPPGTGTVIGRLRVSSALKPFEDGAVSSHEAARAPNSGNVVAQVILDEPVLRSHVPESWEEAASDAVERNQIPTRYDLRIYEENPNMQVFSIDSSDPYAPARLEGTVLSIGGLQPRLDDALRAMHRRRATMHQTTVRKAGKRIRSISDADLRQEELKRLRPDAESQPALVSGLMARSASKSSGETPVSGPAFIGVRRAAQEIESQFARQIENRLQTRLLKRDASSRAIVDAKDENEWRESVTTRVFRLFEEQFWWRLQDLAENLQIPAARLKPVISELCDYNQRGPYRGMYSLKDHLKTENQRAMMDTLFQRRAAELEAARRERDQERENRRREREAVERAAKRAQLVAESDYVDSLIQRDGETDLGERQDGDDGEASDVDYLDES
jgi:hypothetical protein